MAGIVDDHFDGAGYLGGHVIGAIHKALVAHRDGQGLSVARCAVPAELGVAAPMRDDFKAERAQNSYDLLAG